MPKQQSIYQNVDVEHSVKCHSVSCLLDSNKKHISTYAFETETGVYYAESLDEAARLWIKHGAATLIEVSRLG